MHIYTFGAYILAGENDWEWWDKSVPGKLRSLDEDGFRLVFFTNQAGIEKDKVKPETVRNKVEAIIKELAVPVQVSDKSFGWYQQSCPVIKYLFLSKGKSIVLPCI